MQYFATWAVSAGMMGRDVIEAPQASMEVSQCFGADVCQSINQSKITLNVATSKQRQQVGQNKGVLFY